MYFPTDRTAHITAFDGPIVDHWLERKIAQPANAVIGQSKPTQVGALPPRAKFRCCVDLCIYVSSFPAWMCLCIHGWLDGHIYVMC